jgi:hypothetical protein
MPRLHRPALRLFTRLVVVGSICLLTGKEVAAQVSITSPSPNTILPAGPDFATDAFGDPWDMNNVEDNAIDPAQSQGWTGLAFSGGRLGGTTALINGTINNGSRIQPLARAYWNIINPGRTGRRYPINSAVYTKLAF